MIVTDYEIGKEENRKKQKENPFSFLFVFDNKIILFCEDKKCVIIINCKVII